jgi:energy-coupling factor transport system permease protein
MDLLRSLPLGLYLEQPQTWLHRLDPRVKLAWLMSFLAIPILATPLWRLLLVGLLVLLTFLAQIPLRVWRQQMGWLLGFCLLLSILTAILPDGLDAKHQPRLPDPDFLSQPSASPAPTPLNPWLGLFSDTSRQSPSLPQPTSYTYVLFKQGPVTITRRSVDLSIRVGTLFFTLLYSSTLYLLTTAPEEITTGLESLMQPLKRLRVPVAEIALTLTLSLRFIPLVLEEIQNLFRSIRTRAINWNKLGFRGAVQVWMMVAERLLENLLLRAEQVANAMMVRGFTSPNHHRVQWHQLQLRRIDWVALLSLFLLWGARFAWGGVD